MLTSETSVFTCLFSTLIAFDKCQVIKQFQQKRDQMEQATMHQLVYFTALVCLFLSSAATGQFDDVKSHHHHHHHHGHHPLQQLSSADDGNSTKLFVFGDSYADTGNWPNSTAISWRIPYGMTFPGHPSGRFSDGRVLTDYIASGLGINSPVPYNRWKLFGEKLSQLQNGINFAYGGTGVFTTVVNQPNMTIQINTFQQLLEEDQVYGSQIQSSSLVALVSAAGNDYATFLAENGTIEDVAGFTESLMSQLALNLQRIHGLGVQKVCITGLPPLGCLPQTTASTSHANCSEEGNSLAKHHNQMLQETVQKLNNETGGSVFIILDLYTSFVSALHINENHPDSDLLRPCCYGIDGGYSCGSVTNLGVKKYFVCEDPMLSFFWDNIHPSQQGWKAVYAALEPSLQHLLN